MAEKLVAFLAGRGARPGPAARHVVLAAEPTNAILAEPAGATPRPERSAGAVIVWPRDAEERAGAEAALAPHASRIHRMTEVVHWDELGGAPEGALALIYTVRRLPDLSFEAFAAHYRERHAPLARVHHPGIARYVQNFRSDDDAPDAPDAVSELWFASEREARTRFYRDDASRRVIAEDVARFIDLGAGGAFAARPLAARAVASDRSG
jgi:uncharacterized protein (TIGR02118 family)